MLAIITVSRPHLELIAAKDSYDDYMSFEGLTSMSKLSSEVKYLFEVASI